MPTFGLNAPADQSQNMFTNGAMAGFDPSAPNGRDQYGKPIMISKAGYQNPNPGGAQQTTAGAAFAPQLGTVNPGSFGQPQGPGSPMQSPGNNLTNPGYGEQAFEYTQNRLLEDPYGQAMQDQYNQTQNPTQGESYMNQNLGSLDGPGQGDQYWNQVQGQYQDPFAGEQFARQATQQFQANGPASAFNDKVQGQYDDFANYQGGQNTQGQYGQSSASLANGSQGEQGLGQIAGDYGSKGSYSGPNNAAGQYQQNAASGPLAGQEFYDQVSGSYGDVGKYNDPNLSAGQYQQTQQAFGDLPIANFDPFFDRASQLGVQNYNRQAAGRGVYGSSEALSGVGNVITDIEAQRALKGFDAEMQRSVEQRNRQELLGNQARMGDLSSLGAFDANMSGLQTFGNLANNAGQQTLGQQTMLGTQARNADLSATDAFSANLKGSETFANINNQLANTELDRNRLLGDMANNADSQQTSAQNARVSGVNALSSAANNADSAEARRYESSTAAMNNADKTQLDRMNSGADIAFGVDDGNRQDFDSSMNQANSAAQTSMDRTRLGADIASTGSQNDLNRLDSFNNQAQGAEAQRQSRQIAKLDSVKSMTQDLQNVLGKGLESVIGGSQADFENWFEAEMMPALTAAGYDQKRIDGVRSDVGTALELIPKPKSK